MYQVPTVPDTVPGTEATAVNGADRNGCLVELTASGGAGETDYSQNIRKPRRRSDVLQRKRRQGRETKSVKNMRFHPAGGGGGAAQSPGAGAGLAGVADGGGGKRRSSDRWWRRRRQRRASRVVFRTSVLTPPWQNPWKSLSRGMLLLLFSPHMSLKQETSVTLSPSLSSERRW